MRTGILGALCAPLLLAAATALAQSPIIEAEQKAAFEAAERVKVVGPADVALRDQAHLKLPQGYIFVPMPQAGAVMKAMGNRLDDRLVGVVFPAADEAWFVAIKFIHEGYVKDDDAKDWKAADLLASLREGTAAGNAERTRRGFPAIEVVGWAETPRYDAGTHRLVWSVASRETGAKGAAEQGVNYNTYSLGREGYISLNLITDLDKLDKYKPAALQLLAALDYNAGKRYADFNGSTDKVAAYGLATLVAGAAAKKMGFFAVLLAFFAKFAKVILLAGGAALWGLFKLAGRRKAAA